MGDGFGVLDNATWLEVRKVGDVGPKLVLLPERMAICRLASNAPVPAWPTGDFVSVTRTNEELSIVCMENAVPDKVRCERGWRLLRVAGTMDLSAVGVLAGLTAPLAAAGVSIFAISTFDTDYVLVRENDLVRALQALRS
jgi:hypothetical protein